MRNKREVPAHIKARVKTVGKKIAELRQAKHLTQEKLAYGIGIAKSYLGYIERGESNPSLETLLLVAEGLECELEEILK